MVDKISIEKRIKMTARKNWFFLVLLLFSPIVFFGYQSVRGSYDTRVKESKLKIEYGDEFISIKTNRLTLDDALEEAKLKIYEQDSVSLPLDFKLMGGDYEIKIQRSLPIIIDDDGEMLRGRTLFSEPEKILEQNNITYWPEDVLSTELILNPAGTGNVGRLVKIKRAPVFYVKVDRKVKEIRSWDRSVGEIIKKSGTKINPNDIVSPPIDVTLANGANIIITRINYADITKKESIPYTTSYRGTTTIGLGETKVAVRGVIGTKKLVYRVTYKDGEEVSRALKSSTVLKSKIDAIILRGAVTGICKWGPYYENNFGPYTTSFHYPGYVGRYALVTNLANGKSVRVKIVDVGPTNGLLDLSTTAMREIGGSLATFYGSIPNVMVQLL
jgi:uncharacterized protein YabE (DUF348 family)